MRLGDVAGTAHHGRDAGVLEQPGLGAEADRPGPVGAGQRLDQLRQLGIFVDRQARDPGQRLPVEPGGLGHRPHLGQNGFLGVVQDFPVQRLGVVTGQVFGIRIACVEASLQDRAFQLIEGLFVRGAGVPPVQGSGPDGSKLSSVAPAVLAPQEVEPDQSPLGPSEVSQLLAGYDTRNFLTVRHVIRAPSLSPQDIPAGDCGPDAGVLLRLCA